MSTSNILEDISQALEVWSHRILDVETKIKRVTDFRETLVGDLHRKVETVSFQNKTCSNSNILQTCG